MYATATWSWRSSRPASDERQSAAMERERLQAEHAEELERVREPAAGEAMQRLTDVLLGMDSERRPRRRRLGRQPDTSAGSGSKKHRRRRDR